MIEPQNTMMPLAADPAPVELPQGEEGFGAMLAQTLGMVPQLDPNAIQQIAAEQGDGEQETADLAGNSDPGLASSRQPARVGRFATIPITREVAVAEKPAVERPPIIDGRFVDPVYVKDQPVAPPTPTDVPVVQNPDALPQPPAPIQAPIEDGIGVPVLTGEAPNVVGDSLPTTPQPVATPVDEAALAPTPPVTAPPAVDPGGDFDPVDPVVQPRPEPPPAAPIAPPDDTDPVAAPVRSAPAVPVTAEPAQPVVVDRTPITPRPDRGLPVDPAPVADRPTEAAQTIPAATTPTPAAPTVDRPDFAPVATPRFQVSDSSVRVAADNAVPLRDSTVRVEAARPTPQSMPSQAMVVDSSPQPAAPSTPVTTPAAPIQHSALAERVMQAVELQANQPPPRTMVVDIPEIEGLRLVVSVRGGAEVHVVPASASTATDGVQPFLDELQGVLENRGFVMTGDDRRRNRQRQDQDEPAPPRPSRPSFRRAERTDNDLRI